MTPLDLIAQIADEGSEWLEMHECPATYVAGVLAKKVIDLQNKIDYLEKRTESLARKN